MKTQRNFEGVLVEEDENGNLTLLTPPDDSGRREWWCVVNDEGEVLRLMEGRAGCMDEEGILLAIQEDAESNKLLDPENTEYDSCHVYKIGIKEYHQLRKAMTAALESSAAAIPNLGIHGTPYVRPKDVEFLKGERLRLAEYRGGVLRKRVSQTRMETVELDMKGWKAKKGIED